MNIGRAFAVVALSGLGLLGVGEAVLDGGQAVKYGPVAAVQFRVGWMYATGSGVEQNDQKAAEFLEKSASRGSMEAQESMGGLYYVGRGVPQDNQKAMDEWGRAAAQGSDEAQYNLGLLRQKMSIHVPVVSAKL